MSQELQRARVLVDLNRPHEAIVLVSEILASDPTNVEAWGVGAFAHASAKDFAATEEWAEQALALAPNEVSVVKLAAKAMAMAGLTDRSYELFEIGIGLAPFDPELHWGIVLPGLERNTRKSIAVAEGSARRALELAPDDPRSHNAVGSVLLTKGKLKAAEESFGRALELAPNDAAFHQNMALVLQRQRRIRDASEHLVAAGRTNPSDEEPIRRITALAALPAVGIGVMFATVVVSRLASTGLDHIDFGWLPDFSAIYDHAIFKVAVAVGAAGFVFRSIKRDNKKVQLHPDAKAALEAHKAMQPVAPRRPWFQRRSWRKRT